MGWKKNQFIENQEWIILKEAVENTNEAFVTIDQHHRVIFFNRAAERIFGYARDEVIGKDLNSILTPLCSKNHRKAVERYLRTKRPRLIGHETEFNATRKDGATFPASISFSVSEIDGRYFFTALIRDMTETKALQDKIARAERLAELGQLVAEITHEIKNPLISIGGFARRLLRTHRGDKDSSLIEIIAKEAERLENLLSHLRDLYSPRKLVLNEIKIGSLLKEVSDLVMDECDSKGIHLILDIDKDGPIVYGDREGLKQVFINVIKNAIEAIDHNGSISIVSRVDMNSVEVKIEDSGPGISKRDLERLFKPFFTTKKGGTGLGLSVSKRIIEDHGEGYSLNIESQEGRGTRVILRLRGREG